MKKIIVSLVTILLLLTPIKVYASDTAVEVKIEGKVKKGENIEILVNVKDVENFYAASVDLFYDKEQLKVEKIAATDFIKKNVNEIMELGGDTEKNGNNATYSFTFLGDKQGITGSGTLVKISAKVLNDSKLSINEDNLKVKLVQRVGSTVENYSFKFIGYNSIENSTTESNSNSNNQGLNTSNDNSVNLEKNNSNTNESANAAGSDSNTTNQNNSNNNTTTNNNEGQNNKENQEDKENNDKIENQNNIKSKSNNKYYFIALVIILIGVGSGYYFYNKNNQAKDSEVNTDKIDI